ALYRDGLVTLFAVGGLYAAGTLDMQFSDIMLFAIAMNIAGGIGAIAMARMDDKLGSRRTIMICLVMLIGLGAILLLLDHKYAFIGVACLLGLFVGPVQAASRTMLVRLSPPDHVGAFFGLYALTGKSVAFMGPFAFATVTEIFNSQRLGMATILGFWAIGLFLIGRIRAKI
ncbi:MAG TPA: MFS transporter, partial [Alphaproteobacteria bacterium]